MEMSAENKIYTASFSNGDNMTVVEHIRIRMVHHENPPPRLLRRGTHQIFLHPSKRLPYPLPIFCIQRATGIFRIHFEESPRCAVHHDNMRNAVIHGKTVPIRCCVQILRLWS